MRSCRPALSRSARLLLTGLLAGLALAAGPAAASAATAAGSSGTDATARPAVSVAITSVGPAYARPGGKVTVQGVLHNGTRTPVSGVTVQLRSSGVAMADRDELTQYVAGAGAGAGSGTGPGDEAEPGATGAIRGSVPPGGTVTWSVALRVNEVHMSVFGVYPLAAQADAAGAALATARTLLPFWPGGRPVDQPHEDIAWLWPLIDQPDQGACPGLLNNNLAGRLSSGGRLGRLLAAGASPAGLAAKLTWVIDPAVLSSAQAMTLPYVTGSRVTGSSAACSAGTSHAASSQAAAWLGGLRTTVASQPAVITPYADVDIAALVQQGLAGDVHSAFTEGRTIAGQVLNRDFEPSAAGSAGSAAALTGALAWPAAGQANYAMLEPLAAADGIKAVVLSSAAMPPAENVQYTPSAVSSTPDGEGGDMTVLLADSILTQILGSVSATTTQPGAAFAAQQLFLAETAMIAAEAPHLSRAIVVAPPERWNPPASLTSGLLADTTSAPWLSPVGAGSLAADSRAAGQVPRQAPDSVGPGLASPALLRGVAAADHGAAVIQSIQVRPTAQLSLAISGIESAAWRGPAGGQQARAMLGQVQDYIAAQERGVTILEPGRDTLGGQTGPIPISIDNHLPYAVQVRVKLSVSQDQRNGFQVLTRLGTIRIPADTISTTKVKVRAPDIGSTVISLRLTTPEGQKVPGQPVNMTVQATHLGNLTLILIAGALAVFMITSASRAIRRGRGQPDPADPAGPPGPAAPDASAQQHDPDPGEDRADPDEVNVTGRGGHERADRRDTFGHDRAAPAAAGTDLAATEDADDYARVTGWADGR
jgi:hypothetical protein